VKILHHHGQHRLHGVDIQKGKKADQPDDEPGRLLVGLTKK
jgi:hypothetical protein